MHKDPLDDRLLQRAAMPQRGAASGCLDAEVLAAWTDGTLTSAQRDAAQGHAADCDRCLMLLAAMGKTAPPPVIAEPPSWRGWRWVVPLATASVVLTTWIVVRDLPQPSPASPPVTQSATPARPDAPVQQPAQQTSETRRSDPAADAAAGAKTAVEPQAKTSRRADSPVSTGALDNMVPLQRERTQQRNEVAMKDDALSSRTAVASRTPPVASPPAETAPQGAAFRAFAPVLVPSPDPNVQWRVSGSLVERSIDAGKTWVRQSTGTNGVLMAGSSPAPTVCWLVGPAGTVLITVDGQVWRQVSFPDRQANIRSVTATDAAHATVTTADKRTYVTADGGVTWRLQESSPAPF